MIVLINPNSTESMTESMLEAARAAVPDAYIEGWTSYDGPPSIQGEADGIVATQPLLKLVEKASGLGASAIIIACFDDTALDEARALALCPVVGIGQAAYHLAVLAGKRFSVVTTLEVSVPILEENVRRYGLSGHLARVRASGVPVLDLEADAQATIEKVAAEIICAATEDNIESVVLGCGGMVSIVDLAKQRTSIRIVDGVRAASIIAREFSI